jgi:hypothetical protein
MKQLKLISSTILLLAVINNAFSQETNCNTLKLENQKIKQENDYLKQTLGMMEPIQNIVQNGVELKITKVDGSIKEQTLTVTLLLTNHKANDEFQFEAAVQAIDIQGNEYKTSEISIGNSGVRNKLFTDVPIVVKVKFSNVLPITRMFKILNLVSYQVGIFDASNFEYRDLEIHWK